MKYRGYKRPHTTQGLDQLGPKYSDPWYSKHDHIVAHHRRHIPINERADKSTKQRHVKPTLPRIKFLDKEIP